MRVRFHKLSGGNDNFPFRRIIQPDRNSRPNHKKWQKNNRRTEQQRLFIEEELENDDIQPFIVFEPCFLEDACLLESKFFMKFD